LERVQGCQALEKWLKKKKKKRTKEKKKKLFRDQA
jgi:hypothetical protein